jgi:DnaJ-class molecular chaperone
MSKNYYNILEVEQTASQSDIKKAYHKLALLYHPDKNNGEYKDKFVEITTAYDVLSDIEKRKQYDLTLTTPETKNDFFQTVVPQFMNTANVIAMHHANMHNMMSNIHASVMSAFHQSPMMPPAFNQPQVMRIPPLDIHGEVNVTLRDKWNNIYQNVTIIRKKYISPTTTQTISTNYYIPIINNPFILQNCGDVHVPSQSTGDLIIKINLLLPDNYKIINDELFESNISSSTSDYITGVLPDDTEYKIKKTVNVIEQRDPNTGVFTKMEIPIKHYTIPNKGLLMQNNQRSNYNIILVDQ